MAWDASSQILNGVTLTASGSSPAIDSAGATVDSGIVLYQLWVGTVTGTTPNLDVYIEESDDNSTWYEQCKFSGMATATALIAATKTTTTQYQAFGHRTRRYLRERHVISGTNPSFAGLILNSRALGINVPAVPSAT